MKESLFVFQKNAISSASVAEHGSGTNVDFFAVPTKNLSSISALEKKVVLYFKESSTFVNSTGNNVSVTLNVNEESEKIAAIKLWTLTQQENNVLVFDDTKKSYPIDTISGIDSILRTPSTAESIAISCVDGDASDEEKIRLTDASGTTDDIVIEAGTNMSIARTGDKITLTGTATGKTYTVSCVDGDNTDEEKIRLTDSDGGTDDVVLEAAGSLTIARSSDKITFTNDRFDTRLKGDHYPPANDMVQGFGFVDITANYWYGGIFEVAGQMSITHIGIQTKSTDDTDHQIVCGIYKYVYSSDSWTKIVQVGPFTEGVNGKQAIALGSTQVLDQGLYMSVLLADGAQQNMGGIYVANAQPLVGMAMANSRPGFYLFDNSYTYNATLPSTVASGALSAWEYTGHSMPSPFVTLG
jgi:hypothetical protein